MLAAAALAATSCQDEEKDLGLPEIKISQSELSAEQGVASTTLNVYATRDWSVSTAADWISVNPSKGDAYTETKVTVTVLENEGYNRTGTVKFDIGYDSKTFTINQIGALGEKSEGAGTADDPYTVAGVLEYIGTLGTETSADAVYIKGKVQAVTLTYAASGSYGNARFTMVDEGGSNVFTAYNVLYLGNKRWSAGQEDIKEGDEVIVCGKVYNYGGRTPETASGAYLYSLNGVSEAAPGTETGSASGTGALDDPYNVAGVLEYIGTLGNDVQSPAEVYVKGVVASVSEAFSTNFGNATFVMSDAGVSNSFTAYRILYLGNRRWATGDTQIAEGDEVIVYGKVVNFRGYTPETVTNSAYLYSLNGKTDGGSTGGGGGDTGDENIFSETFASSQGNFTIDNKNLPSALSAVWTFDSRYGMKATGYANSTNYDSESWLVSPEIDLTSQTTAFLSFEHAGNYFESADKTKEQAVLKISKDNGATWDAVAIPEYFTSWTFVSSGEISLASYVGSKIKIAFCYSSTASKAGTWEVKNVKVYKTSNGGGSTGGGGDTGNGVTIALNNSLSWTAETDATYKTGLTATTQDFKIGGYQHTGGTAINPSSTFLQSDHIRVYKNSVLAVTAPAGKTIKSIKITPSAASYLLDVAVLEGGGSANKGSSTIDWSGSASKVVFHMTAGQVRVKNIIVTLE